MLVWVACLVTVLPRADAMAGSGSTGIGVAVNLETDFDGDGVADSIRVVCRSRNARRRTGEYSIDVRVRGRTFGVPVSNLDGIVGPRRAQESLPDEIADLQMLRPDPLAVYDINADGRPEVVAHFKVPLSHTSHHMVILGWEATRRKVVKLFEQGNDQWLLMDTTNHGDPVLVGAYVHGPPQWGGYEPVPTLETRGRRDCRRGVPSRLARRLVPYYAEVVAGCGPWGYEEVMDGLALSLAARAGTEEERQLAESASRAVGEADSSRIRDDAAWHSVVGHPDGRLAGLRPGGDGPFALSTFESPVAFMAYCAAFYLVAAGEGESALHWLSEAERLEGRVGRFGALRAKIPVP